MQLEFVIGLTRALEAIVQPLNGQLTLPIQASGSDIHLGLLLMYCR